MTIALKTKLPFQLLLAAVVQTSLPSTALAGPATMNEARQQLSSVEHTISSGKAG